MPDDFISFRGTGDVLDVLSPHAIVRAYGGNGAMAVRGDVVAVTGHGDRVIAVNGAGWSNDILLLGSAVSIVSEAPVPETHDPAQVERAGARADGFGTRAVTEMILAAPEVHTAADQAELDAGAGLTDPNFVAGGMVCREAQQVAYDEAQGLFAPPTLDLPDNLPPITHRRRRR